MPAPPGWVEIDGLDGGLPTRLLVSPKAVVAVKAGDRMMVGAGSEWRPTSLLFLAGGACMAVVGAAYDVARLLSGLPPDERP